MKAAVVSVGNEIVFGATVDTNSSLISMRLMTAGWEVISHASIVDDRSAIRSCIEDLAGECGLIVISGGLGPTADDVTRDAVSEYSGKALVSDERWRTVLQDRYGGRSFSGKMLSQTLVAEGSLPLDNEVGTALGFLVPGEPLIAVLPGVPSEMIRMLDGYLVPAITGKTGEVVLRRAIGIFGERESYVDSVLAGIIDPLANPSVGITAEQAVIKVTATARAETREKAGAMLDEFESVVKERLGNAVYGTDEQDLASCAVALLKESGSTLAVAESCTGGLVSHRITDIPGASSVLLAGVVAYSNGAKISQLGVQETDLLENGAVSESVALAMAEGVRKKFYADYGIGVTGIAGPGGGTGEKPVGLVWIAVAGQGGSHAEQFRFHGTRSDIKVKSSNAALDMLRRAILD